MGRDRRSWAQRHLTTAQRGYGAAWRRVRAEVLKRDGHTCAYCGGSANSVDHVVPKQRGGTDDPDNLVAACSWCNTSKGNRSAPRPRRARISSREW